MILPTFERTGECWFPLANLIRMKMRSLYTTGDNRKKSYSRPSSTRHMALSQGTCLVIDYPD